jgi:hypothetical protein
VRFARAGAKELANSDRKRGVAHGEEHARASRAPAPKELANSVIDHRLVIDYL